MNKKHNKKRGKNKTPRFFYKKSTHFISKYVLFCRKTVPKMVKSKKSFNFSLTSKSNCGNMSMNKFVL